MGATIGQPTCRIIGNIGDNHNGNPDLAKRLIEIAISAGCNAVVLPHRRPNSGYTHEALAQPVVNGLREYITLGQTLQALELSSDTIKELRGACRGHLEFVGAPYDLEAFSDLEDAQPDGYQVDPPVLSHAPLLEAMASTGRPIILVAGMCAEEDVAAAVDILGNVPLTILHSVYAPGLPLNSTALWCIPMLRQKFDAPVGYMGMEGGNSATLTAFGMGARIIERMFTSDKFLPGLSHATSLDRDELRELVGCIRSMEEAVSGSPPRILQPVELADSYGHQASLVAAYDLVAGSALDESMLAVKLASDGVRATQMRYLLGRRLAYDVAADSPLTFGAIEV